MNHTTLFTLHSAVVLYQSCNKNYTNILFNWVLFAFGSTKHLVQHLSNDDCLEDQWRSQKLWELRSRGVVFGGSPPQWGWVWGGAFDFLDQNGAYWCMLRTVVFTARRICNV